MLRVPSECLPLELDGHHSQITLEDQSATITLFNRKNTAAPSTLRRHCVCKSEGRSLCGVCDLRSWLQRSQDHRRHQIFTRSYARFMRYLRSDASDIGMPDAMRLGSHAFRRGMARDIVKCGGSLATLLRAGQWRSRSFMVYLQEHTLDELAVARLMIDHSDDED